MLRHSPGSLAEAGARLAGSKPGKSHLHSPTALGLQACGQVHVAFTWVLRTQPELFLLVKQMLSFTEPSLQLRGRGFIF